MSIGATAAAVANRGLPAMVVWEAPALDPPSRAAGRRAHAARLRERAVTSKKTGVKGQGESDEELMARAGRGDHRACEELVERHLGRIHAFASRVLGSTTEGEDVAQEVFLRLWKHADRWKPAGAKLSTWLYRVALNLCLNKKERRRETPTEHVAETVAAGDEPGAIVGRRDMERQVNSALRELPTNQRAAITMCHYQGLKNAEAAEVLGVSVEALESLLARGRRAMRARLAAIAGELLEGGGA